MVMTQAETATPEEAARLTDVLRLERRGAPNRCQWLRGSLSEPSGACRQTAVAIVADAAVKWQCRGASQHYHGWKQAVAQGTHLPADRAASSRRSSSRPSALQRNPCQTTISRGMSRSMSGSSLCRRTCQRA